MKPKKTVTVAVGAFTLFFSASASVLALNLTSLRLCYGDEETSFDVVTNAMPGVTRQFHSFSAALVEVMNARVLGGIHFRTACVDGTALGISVGDYALSHSLVPLDGKPDTRSEQ